MRIDAQDVLSLAARSQGAMFAPTQAICNYELEAHRSTLNGENHIPQRAGIDWNIKPLLIAAMSSL